MRFRLLLCLALTTACEISGGGKKQDTSVVVPSSAATDTMRRDSATVGVPAVPPADSASRAAAADTGVVQITPIQPKRGGVILAVAQGLVMEAPRCSWHGSPLPCYRAPDGVRALIPLSAEDSAGTFSLTIDRPTGGRITRQITVQDAAFGQQLVFLDPVHYALVARGADVARDARSVRQLLSGESPEQHWSGKWGLPVRGGKSSAYGVDRFYYRASDSARAITITQGQHSRGSFGNDTSQGTPTDVPSWRHAGVDIAVPKGTAVHAPAAGVVADVSDYILTGHTVIVDHGQGVHSAYFHLDTSLVRRGDVVREGSVLGRVGATGLATGPHLHYGIYIHGRDVDPAAWNALPPLPSLAGDSPARRKRP
ncbi:MAG: M23 family metallopeptidase [Gemmatimonadota bacterium]|nr:M23 family metallopeptidase [Gemmatimonadota bacterium]